MKTAWRRIAIAGATVAMLGLATACTMAITRHNREAVSQLHRGMTRDQVLGTMGVPLTKESYHEPDVWYYYTERRWADGAITRDECTPVVFEGDQLVGWGHDFLRQYRHEAW